MNIHSPARLVREALLAAGCAALAACAIGPAYHPPTAPRLSRYTAVPEAAAVPAAPAAHGSLAHAQTLERGHTVDSHWWRAFGSPDLDVLVARALRHNPDIAAAQATLRQASEELRAARGLFYPQIALGLGAERTRTSGAATGGSFGPQLYNLYTGQVSVGYNPDVFAVNRLVTRGAHAEVDVARSRLDAARLALSGNVVDVVLQLAALQDEIAATHSNVDSQQRALRLIQTQYQLGAVAQFEVFTQQSLLASTQAQLTQLQQARDAALHLLATYLGVYPTSAATLALPKLSRLTLPTDLPLSLPSALVQARPDIRAAEAQLRAANAEVGIAVARMYPSLQLSASWGAQSNLTRTFLDPASRLWDIGAGLAAPLFEGGTLRAQKQAAQAAYRAVFANYQSTVLQAFRNVADVLRALQHDSAFLDAQARALHAAHAALALVRIEYRAGEVDYLSLLTSETQYQKASIAFVAAEAQRLADTAALYVALGGGRWNADPMQPAAAASARAPAPTEAK
ncbi:MAG: efflux transporter outer membrane subunit [Steroidobacteraceae bacterium]